MKILLTSIATLGLVMAVGCGTKSKDDPANLADNPTAIAGDTNKNPPAPPAPAPQTPTKGQEQKTPGQQGPTTSPVPSPAPEKPTAPVEQQKGQTPPAQQQPGQQAQGQQPGQQAQAQQPPSQQTPSQQAAPEQGKPVAQPTEQGKTPAAAPGQQADRDAYIVSAQQRLDNIEKMIGNISDVSKGKTSVGMIDSLKDRLTALRADLSALQSSSAQDFASKRADFDDKVAKLQADVDAAQHPAP